MSIYLLVALAVVGYAAIGVIFACVCVDVLDWSDDGFLVALYWLFWPLCLLFAVVITGLLVIWGRALERPAVWLFTLAKRVDKRAGSPKIPRARAKRRAGITEAARTRPWRCDENEP